MFNVHRKGARPEKFQNFPASLLIRSLFVCLFVCQCSSSVFYKREEGITVSPNNFFKTMSTHIIKKKNSIAFDDSSVAPHYKPRYVLEETKSLHQPNPYDGDKQSFVLSYFCSFCSVRCILRLCCGSKWRILLMVSLGLFSYLFNSILIESAVRSMNVGGYSSARRQSFLFFDDIPHSKWYLLRKRVRKIRRKQEIQHRHEKKHYSDARKFYQRNYPAEFTCPHEERVGGMKGGGGKWLCNPKNIAIASADRTKNQGNGCLIYTSSADINGFQFESSLLEIIGQDCEIHVFHPNDINLNLLGGDIPAGLHLHPWGFRSTRANSDDHQLKTVQETVVSLGHEGHTIDLLSLDCEGCEFDIYQDLVQGGTNSHQEYNSPVFMQMIIQVHGAPPVSDDFFREIQNHGYVIYHRSPSAEGTGKEQDYGFLKLSQDFFI